MQCRTCRAAYDAPGPLGDEVCSRCGERAFSAAAMEALLPLAALARDDLLLHHLRAGGVDVCAVCQAARASVLLLRGHTVHLCAACGTLRLPYGALAAWTGGRFDELAPRTRAALPFGDRAVLLLQVDADAAALRSVAASLRVGRGGEVDRIVARARDGVFLEHLTAEAAHDVVQRLAREGVDARVVPRADYRAPGVVTTLDLRLSDGDGLSIADSLGRPELVPWSALRAVGVGAVMALRRPAPVRPLTGVAGVRVQERVLSPFLDVAVDGHREVRARWSMMRATVPPAQWRPRATAILDGCRAAGVPMTRAALRALYGGWPVAVDDDPSAAALAWLLWRIRQPA